MNIPVLPQSSQNVIETIKEYGKRLFGFIRNRVKTDEDAEDILQDVWYQLTHLDSGPVERLGAWLRALGSYASPLELYVRRRAFQVSRGMEETLPIRFLDAYEK